MATTFARRGKKAGSDPVGASDHEYLHISGLTRIYPGGAGIRGVDLVAERGELLSLLGSSGCGKTTTLRCLAGIDRPDSGTIRIAGGTMFASPGGVNVPTERRDIGMVFQSYALWPHMTVQQNVEFPLRSRGVGRAEAKDRATAMIDMVGLGHLVARSPGQLSGGQQQRVALARALVYEPKLLLLDEPLSNLDAQLRESVRQEIRRVQRETSITAVYVTHDRAEAMTLSDRIVVMADGRIVQVGTPRELLAEPATEFVASLLGSANVVRATIESVVADGAGAVVTVLVNAGEPNAIRLAGRGSASLTVGAPGSICIRPTEVRLAPASAGGTGIRARVRDCYPTGPEFEYVLDLGGKAVLKTTTPADLGLAPGDEVDFSYDTANARCFETQR